MIRSGLVSISFRSWSVEKIIALSVEAGLSAIEWGGDVHVPHGDTETARRVGRLTREVGLDVAAYGSYYKLGASEADGLDFQRVLDTALALGAPTVRVWAGTRSTHDADEDDWIRVVEDARRSADLAKAAGARVCFEYHNRTLTDNHQDALRLYDRIGHDHVDLLWQSPYDKDFLTGLASLKAMLPRISNVHVYWWTRGTRPGEVIRHALTEAQPQWRAFVDVLRSVDRDRYALLEYVRNDSAVQLQQDAMTLNAILAGRRCAGA